MNIQSQLRTDKLLNYSLVPSSEQNSLNYAMKTRALFERFHIRPENSNGSEPLYKVLYKNKEGNKWGANMAEMVMPQELG